MKTPDRQMISRAKYDFASRVSKRITGSKHSSFSKLSLDKQSKLRLLGQSMRSINSSDAELIDQLKYKTNDELVSVIEKLIKELS